MKILGADVQGKCVPLGSFQVEGTTLLVTDPCYELGTWCQVQIKKAEPGTWKGYLFRRTDPRDVEHLNTIIAREQEKVDSHRKKIEGNPLIEEIVGLLQERVDELKRQDMSRVSVLMAHHESIDPFTSFDNEWGRVKGEAGVDSGQMSICGLEFWKKNPLDYEGEETIDPETGYKNRGRDGDYWKVCDITLEAPGGGVFKNGAVVSQSGYGDGGYEVFRLAYDKKVLGVAVVFIPDWLPEDE